MPIVAATRYSVCHLASSKRANTNITHFVTFFRLRPERNVGRVVGRHLQASLVVQQIVTFVGRHLNGCKRTGDDENNTRSAAPTMYSGHLLANEILGDGTDSFGGTTSLRGQTRESWPRDR